MLLLALSLAGATAAPGIDPRHAAELLKMEVELHDAPPRFLLRYRGKPLEFRGFVCYAFAGYNETCVDPDIEWLTPATVIALAAPGGVPREFLAAYDIYVRFPGLSGDTFRYPQGR